MNLKESQIIKVAIDVPVDDLFDYRCSEQVDIGQFVVVPFGSRKLIGIVVEVGVNTTLPPNKIKEVIRVDEESLFNSELFKLFRFVASYYQYPIGQTIHTAVPSRIKQGVTRGKKKNYIFHASNNLTLEVIHGFPKNQKNLIRIATQLLAQPVNEATLKTMSNWKKHIEYLINHDLATQQEVTPEAPQHSASLTLNSEQSKIVEKIKQTKGFEAFLIHGITGSGKTEVYMHLIDSLIKNEGQVLVMVPEINLTPQLEDRFQSRFHTKKIVSLHSHLSQPDRLENWRLAKSGEAQIVIGTRLSVFTPFKKLTAILMDEEHDMSFKQQDNLRYHARDVGMMRAKLLNIPFIAGSATPSMEIWHRAVNEKKLKLLSLTKRANEDATLPRVDLIKTSQDLDEPLSTYLKDAIQYRLDQQQQVLIFINRRGFAPVLFCSSCGWQADCSRCSSKLVVHKNKQQLRCHHCDYQRTIDSSCQDCGNVDLMTLGKGTQKIEEQLARLFPLARIKRVDRDTIRNKKDLDQLYADMHDQKLDILVGTQMLSKGHDFPQLTLVGILDADHALYSSDFRAGERLFSQLVQVAGRSGRASIKGEVVIETNFPEHPLYKKIQSQDFNGFAEDELQLRKELHFPPFVMQAMLKTESKNKKHLEEFVTRCFQFMSNLPSNVTCFPPVRPFLERLQGFERSHIYMQSNNRTELNHFLSQLRSFISTTKISSRVKWVIDVDPVEF